MALKYWDDFGSPEMYFTRARAAKALKENAKQLGQDDDYHDPDVDDVLDIFEDLGFYVQGDQLTPEVAHQDFYYWIRGYYSIARDYLEKKQKGRPNQWKGVRYLFEITHEVEIEQRGEVDEFLSDKERDAFFAEEMYDPDQARTKKKTI